MKPNFNRIFLHLFCQKLFPEAELDMLKKFQKCTRFWIKNKENDDYEIRETMKLDFAKAAQLLWIAHHPGKSPKAGRNFFLKY